MRRNIIYDSNLAPVNRISAIVISAGTSYEPACKIQVEEFTSPPPLRQRNQYPKDNGFIDLAGRKKGRFTVIGLLAGGNARTWVVRCACVTYTTRTTKSIKSVDRNPAANLDACRECMHLAYIKRNEIYRRTGRNADIRDVF